MGLVGLGEDKKYGFIKGGKAKKIRSKGRGVNQKIFECCMTMSIRPYNSAKKLPERLK